MILGVSWMSHSHSRKNIPVLDVIITHLAHNLEIQISIMDGDWELLQTVGPIHLVSTDLLVGSCDLLSRCVCTVHKTHLVPQHKKKDEGEESEFHTNQWTIKLGIAGLDNNKQRLKKNYKNYNISQTFCFFMFRILNSKFWVESYTQKNMECIFLKPAFSKCYE